MVKTSKLVLRPFIPTGMVASGNAEEDAKRIGFLKEKRMDRREQYATLTYGNLLADGVVDPVKVTRSAVVNAASVARMILTTESAVVEKPTEEVADTGHGHSH